MRLTQAEAGELERVNAARALLVKARSAGVEDYVVRTVLHELHASRCNLGPSHTGECRPGSDESATAESRTVLVNELAALVTAELHNVLMLLPESAEAAGLAVAEAVVEWAEADPWPPEEAAGPAGELPSRPGGGGAAAAAHPRPESMATSPMIDSREDHGRSAIPQMGGRL